MLSVNTNSLRHLPKRSSNNCDMQFANNDRFKENYRIDSAIDYEMVQTATLNVQIGRCSTRDYML